MKTVAVVFIISFAVTVGMLIWLIPVLRRACFQQSILEEGPRWHLSKSGTPTMGGIAIVSGVIIALIIGSLVFQFSVLLLCGVFIYFSLIGFVDDYIKIVKKRNLGLNRIQKLILQFIGAVALAIYAANDVTIGTVLYVPFYHAAVDFHWLYYPFTVFAVLGVVNAVNFTDGLDGLASSVSAVVFLFFVFAAIKIGHSAGGAMSAACLGACVGFLIFNHYPAKIFMGDTGAMALGGAVILLAVVMRLQIFILLTGAIYVLEALSVVLQINYFKYTRIKTGTGKRIFKMAPIHHHFEMSGMSENHIVALFTLITIITSVVAFIALLVTV